MKKLLITTFIGVILLVTPFLKVTAEENVRHNFSVTPLAEGSNDAQTSYYDLKVKPNDQKKLNFRLVNPNDVEVKIKMEANNASTNQNGITSYLKEKTRDSSLDMAFSDIAILENKHVTIPKNSETIAAVNVNIPSKPFEGTILGGIRFTLEEDRGTTDKAEASVKSNIAYTIGVALTEQEGEISPELVLNDVITEQRNYRNYISSNLQNTSPRIIKKLKVSASVTKENETSVLYEAAKSDMRMAPNSNFDFGINLEDHPFKPGKYTIKVQATADTVPFEFEKNFTITSKEAATFNKNAVNMEASNFYWVWIVSVLLVLVIIGLIIHMIRSKKQTQLLKTTKKKRRKTRGVRKRENY